ncbi:MAG TPA: alpha/beta hydrolase [Candidatus Lokiarchaeia archaeon]|nr:alpha/beta hydrolase [Candidatus Lokiarchaeia archaeon]
MVGEKAYKALSKIGKAWPKVTPWIERKQKEQDDFPEIFHEHHDWIPGTSKPWKQDMYVSVHAPVDKEQVKGVIVAFHGLGNFGEREFFYFAPWFAARGYIVITPDLPYFGHNVKHHGVHGRIGKWSLQIDAMADCIKWGINWASEYTGRLVNAENLPWFLVGISMSGLGVLDFGLNNFTVEEVGQLALDACRGVVALVPAVKFRLAISPVLKALALLLTPLFPNFVYNQQTPPDPATGFLPNSHDLESVAWCTPCIESGADFGLEGDDAIKEFEIDLFPGTAVSTVVKLYLAAREVNARASEWPSIPLFCTGSKLDDLVDPTGASEFLAKIDQAILHQFKLYEGFYHSQLCELGREALFEDILSFLKKC